MLECRSPHFYDLGNFMEIIVLFLMAITVLIGWIVFSPFASLERIQEWTFAKPEVGDLLALFLPCSGGLALFTHFFAKYELSTIVLVSLIPSFILALAAVLLSGLYLLDKLRQPSSAKRIVLIGFGVANWPAAHVRVGSLPTVCLGHVDSFCFASDRRDRSRDVLPSPGESLDLFREVRGKIEAKRSMPVGTTEW